MRYVVIGASAAGINAIATLRQNDKKADIVLIAPDEFIHCRGILHKFISGERERDKLSFVEDGFIENNEVDWKKTKATGINLDAKEVKTERYGSIGYDKLLIAVGSRTKMPLITNLSEAKNVFSLSSFEDALAIKEAAAKAKNIAVLGTGLIGCDILSGLAGFKAKISAFESGPHMLPLNLDEHTSSVYQKAFAKNGVEQHYNVKVVEAQLDGAGNIRGLTMDDDRRFDCGMLIVASGVRANTGFLKGCGLEMSGKGLLYDATGKTSNEHVYGAGDISGLTPIWSAAVKEGIVAANNMSGVTSRMTDFFAVKSSMNFFGIPTMSIGTPVRPNHYHSEVVDLDKEGNYKKIICIDGEIKGAILQGDLSHAGILTQLIREKIDVSRVTKSLFKIDYSDFFGEFVF